jgi:AcrR family transcriptional regulator
MKSRNTRQRILDAAQRLIEREGAAGLTTLAIAREAGCAEGTLFKHFKRKEDLCLAVVLENSPRLKETIARTRAGVGSVPGNLEAIAHGALRFSHKLVPLAVSLFADAGLLARHRKAMQESGRGPKEMFGLIAAYIGEEARLGRIDSGIDAPMAAALLLGPCFQRAFIRQATGRNPLAVADHEFITGLVATLMRGLAPSKPGRRHRTKMR